MSDLKVGIGCGATISTRMNLFAARDVAPLRPHTSSPE